MNEERIKEIEEALADNDGSLIDINMESLDWDDIVKFLDFYVGHYRLDSTTNGEGKEVLSLYRDGQYKEMFSNSNSLKITGAGKDFLVQDLNVDVFRNEMDTYDLELDFKPEDYNFDEFLKFLKPIVQCFKKREYFLKYENVSLGYENLAPDVIFSHNDILF